MECESATPTGPFWIDDGREPLETVENVEELMRMVHALKAERIIQKLRKGTYYLDSLAD